MPHTATLGELDKLERQLQTEQTQLDSKAAQLMEAREKINEIRALLAEIQPTKRAAKPRATTVPSAAEIRSVVRSVLIKRKTVPGAELMSLVHEHFGISRTKNVNDSPVAARVYQVVASLKSRGYIRRLGKNKRTLAATARGRNTKSWG